MPIKNRAATERFFKKAMDMPRKVMSIKVMQAANFAHNSILDRTPVHTGQTLRNWKWSVGSPDMGQVLEARGSGSPGETSILTLGAESRRASNRADPDASFAKLNTKNPFQTFWMTNNSPAVLGLEFGKLPDPERSRNPAGMVRVTVQNLMMKLNSGKI